MTVGLVASGVMLTQALTGEERDFRLDEEHLELMLLKETDQKRIDKMFCNINNNMSIHKG